MSVRPLSLVVPLAAAVVLSGCEPRMQRLGTDPSCDRPGEREHTPPMQVFRVVQGDIQTNTDTIVQPPGVGWFGWHAAGGYAWRITFTEDVPPTQQKSYSGGPGDGPVFARIREDAECRYYKWDIKMWERGAEAGDTLRSDPGGLVEPWGG